MKISRRDFSKIFSGFSFLAFSKIFLSSKYADAEQINKPLADPTKGMAKKIVYHHSQENAEKDVNTVKDKLKVETPWEQRFCDNCKHYQTVGEKESKKVGTCALIPGYLVVDKGICNLWKPT